MRLLFNAYPTNCQGGGAVIKLTKLREYLAGRGHLVDLFDPWSSKIEEYDIYHHFSMFPSDLPMIRFAKAADVKVCIETMYWGSWRHAITAPTRKLAVRARRIARYAQRRIAPRTTYERALLEIADVVFVNSEFEKLNVGRDFGIAPGKIAVCYNGADRTFAKGDPALFTRTYGIEKFVLVTGIFEERKNQLGLIRALKNTDMPLVLIGATPPVHKWYLEKCKAEAGPNVWFIDEMNHDDPMFRSAYAACSVLVLPSWHETTVKSALEAALLGKNVVMTKSAPAAKEYFGNLVTYVDPNNVEGMRSAVLAAHAAPSPKELQERVSDRFTWDIVAAEREQRYQSLLDKRLAVNGGNR